MRRPLAFVLAIGLLIRVVFLKLYAERLPFLDNPLGAAALWTDLATRWRASGLPHAPFFDAPGYPIFLAMVGAVRTGGMAVAVAQLVLGLVTTLLAALVAGRLFGRRESLLTAILLTLIPAPFFLETKALDAALAALLGLLMVWLLLLADHGIPMPMSADEELARRRARADGFRPKPAGRMAAAAALAAGLLAGGLTLLRGAFLLPAIVMTVVLLARALQARRPWNTTLLFGAGVLVGFLPLGLHNGWYGAPSLTPVGASYRFFQACERGGPLLPVTSLSPESEADSLMKADLGRVLDPGPEMGYWLARAGAEIQADSRLWWRKEGDRLLILLGRYEEQPGASFPLETVRIPARRVTALPGNFLIAAGLIGILLAAGRLGSWRGARHSLVGAVSLLVAVGLSGILISPASADRYPAIPLLAAGAAHALVRADDAWRRGRHRKLLLLGGTAFLFVIATWNSPLGPWRRPASESRLFSSAGSIRELAGRDDEAAALFRDALAIDRGDVAAAIHLSQIELRRRDLAAAIQPLEVARGVVTDNFALRNNLGLLYLQAQRLSEADREMQAAISLDPREAGPWYYRGQIARTEGDSAAALIYYQEAIRRDGRFLPAWGRLIDLLLDLRRPAEARSWADRAGESGLALPADLAGRLRSAETALR